MRFGYTIIYVADVQASIRFYNDAFGIATRFFHESGDYAELETGQTTLALASYAIADSHFPKGYTKLKDLEQPAGIEIALVTEDVPAAVQSAAAAGAEIVSEPAAQPWGQIVAYVRAQDGTLIELCTPMGD